MKDRDALTVSSRERMRQEIAGQVADFLNSGGRIEYLHNTPASARPVGSVWWETRGSGSLLNS